MSANAPEPRVPEVLDAARMVAARRQFEGVLPLSAMHRLRGSLVDAEGDCRFSLSFDRDPVLNTPYVELMVEAALPLECQRTLRRFLFPVKTVQRLGLIRDVDEESALPPEYEPLLVPADGLLHPADLVEDELVLAVPVVALSPDSDAVEREWTAPQQETAAVSPFAALAALKKPS